MQLEFNRNNRLSTCVIVDDNDYTKQVGIWLSGRIFGKYIGLFIPWKRKI